MRQQEMLKVDPALIEKYCETFPDGIDTISMPDMTAGHFTEIMETAIRSGVPIDFVKEGWDPEHTDEEIADGAVI
jgi:hypothetical protein